MGDPAYVDEELSKARAALADADRLAGYHGYERATALFNEQLDAESADEWQAHARRPHPSVADGE